MSNLWSEFSSRAEIPRARQSFITEAGTIRNHAVLSHISSPRTIQIEPPRQWRSNIDNNVESLTIDRVAVDNVPMHESSLTSFQSI